MIAVNAILYGVVVAASWMLTTASIAAMGAVLALIIAVAGGLVRWIGHLMGSEEYAVGTVSTPATSVAASRPVPVATGRAAHA